MAVAVYLLESEPTRRTYVGCTTSGVAHRLRQHNGDLSGGAAQTASGRPWRVVLLVQGFRTRQEGLQFEYAWRRVHRRLRRPYTVAGRRASLEHLRTLPRWSSRAPPASEVPLRVTHQQICSEPPTQPMDMKEPTEATLPKEPTLATEPKEATLSMVPTPSSESMAHADAAESSDSALHTE